MLLCVACKKHESGFEIRERVASSGEAFSAALEQTVGSPSKAILDLLANAGTKSDSKLAFLWAQTDYGQDFEEDCTRSKEQK